MSEEYDDDDDDDEIPEQEETNLRGEYVWDGSYLSSANIDVNDTGHEGFFLQQIASNLAEPLIELIEKNIKKIATIPEEELSNSQSEINDNSDNYISKLEKEEINVEELKNIIDICEESDPSLFLEFKNKNKELLDGIKDPRKWGCKQGNIISRNHSFELWGWDSSKASNLLDMVYEIAQEDVVSPTTSLDIHDYNTGKSFVTTVGELEAGEKLHNVADTSIIKTKNIYIDPTWQKGVPAWRNPNYFGDNNNFVKFKDWMKLRENSIKS